jgi:hypothetical protein
MMVWVWPPQISISTQGRVARKRDFGGQDSRDLLVPILVDVLHGGPIPKKNLARFEHRGGDLCHKVFKAAACAG